MIDTLYHLAVTVADAIEREPPAELLEFCTDLYYRPYYHLLHLLARKSEHGVCVELGVEKGRASLAMALGGGNVYAMDHTRRGEIAVLEARFPGHFHFIEQPSLPIPEQIQTLGQPISLLHIDTEHSYAQAREEFYAYQPLLAMPAVVCFDDTHAQESEVGHFVTTLPWPTIFDDRLHECGYAVMLYMGEGT